MREDYAPDPMDVKFAVRYAGSMWMNPRKPTVKKSHVSTDLEARLEAADTHDTMLLSRETGARRSSVGLSFARWRRSGRLFSKLHFHKPPFYENVHWERAPSLQTDVPLVAMIELDNVGIILPQAVLEQQVHGFNQQQLFEESPRHRPLPVVPPARDRATRSRWDALAVVFEGALRRLSPGRAESAALVFSSTCSGFGETIKESSCCCTRCTLLFSRVQHSFPR